MNGPFYKSPVAAAIPFDNSINGFSSTQVQSAIEELNNVVSGKGRGLILSSYNGNANTGRFLEFFAGIDSNIAPILFGAETKILDLVIATTAINATCTIGFYNDTTLLYTATFTAQKQIVLSGTSTLPIFTIPTNGLLKIKIDSGSINRPHLYFAAVT